MVMERAFKEPSGVPGRIGAAFMARMSKPMHRWAIELLDPQPGERVLEIGPAHGALVERMDRAVPDLRFGAVDPSPDMVRLTMKRNRELVDSDRLDVREGRVSGIPFEDASFDRIVSTHTIYFWPDIESDLREVLRVLRPGGRLVIGFRATQNDMGEWCMARNGGNDVPSDMTVVGLREKCALAGLVNLKAKLRHLTGRGPMTTPTLGAVVGDKRTA
jgi:SAM-dependent methyltransferase